MSAFGYSLFDFSLPIFIFACIGAVITIVLIVRDRIRQLSYQNRLLTSLRSLDIVALSTTEIYPLCQAIVNVMAEELGYFFGEVALVDEKLGVIKRMAISDIQQVDKLLKSLPIKFHEQAVSINEKENLLVQVVEQKKSIYTDSLASIQKGVFTKEYSQKIQEWFKLKGVFLYPIISKRKVIGVAYYASMIDKKNVSKYEYIIMEEFTAEVSRVLENVFLYQDLKHATTELAQANQKLKDLDKLKDDFVSVASHELRTPMTAIRSYAWMALHRADVPLSEKMTKYLSRTLISTERLINLVNDMLNISRIESGRVEIIPKPFRMVDLVADVATEVGPKAAEKKLQIHILNSQTPQVFADPDKIHQVLLNLIGNAMKFTPIGGSITISFFSDGKSVETAVKDSGVGISKEDMSQLFTKFGRLDNSYVAAATSGGTGLGLYICKSLVELMKGRIWVQSEGAGKGSTFIFTLPVASADALAHPEKYIVKSEGEAKTLEQASL